MKMCAWQFLLIRPLASGAMGPRRVSGVSASVVDEPQVWIGRQMQQRRHYINVALAVTMRPQSLPQVQSRFQPPERFAILDGFV